jgi:hypothetical protein
MSYISLGGVLLALKIYIFFKPPVAKEALGLNVRAILSL